MIRPALQKQYELVLQKARKTPMNQGAIDVFWQAADVFAGSTEAGELDLRHRALFTAASTLRQQGDLQAAEALYARLAVLAEEDSGAGSFDAGLAWYFVGILRNQRSQSAAAVEPFQKALAVFASSPEWKTEARSTAASLGLALLREQRWDEVTTLLRRYVGQGGEDETQAALLHNLTIAGARSNLRELMVPIGEQAVALRKKLNGVGHPLYADTLLALAWAQVEAGEQERAAATIREAAAIVLGGAGEQHPSFADALLVEARRLARLGDGPAAEGLARRALHLLEGAQLDEATLAQRRRDAAAIAPLWRPGSYTGAPLRLWHAKLQHTLRRYQARTLDYAGSGDRPLEWLFFGPTEVDENSPAGLALMRCAVAEENRRLNAREPGDPNLLDFTSAEVSLPLDEAVLALPFQALWKSRVWEVSVAWSLVDPRNPVPLLPAQFARALTAYLASHGTTAGVAQALSVFELEPLLAQQAREHPQQVLFEVLEAPSS